MKRGKNYFYKVSINKPIFEYSKNKLIYIETRNVLKIYTFIWQIFLFIEIWKLNLSPRGTAIYIRSLSMEFSLAFIIMCWRAIGYLPPSGQVVAKSSGFVFSITFYNHLSTWKWLKVEIYFLKYFKCSGVKRSIWLQWYLYLPVFHVKWFNCILISLQKYKTHFFSQKI